jgi:hypothetical protein
VADRPGTGPGPDAAADTRPHIARVYDYLLGGTSSFPADRAVAEAIMARLPAGPAGVRAQRDLLGRVVRYPVGEAGVRQLLDIGSGLPTAENVHEIAHHIDPGTRVVYVDNDPVVLARPEVREQLDWEQPIGLLLCGILHYVLDEEDPAGILATLSGALPAGSYVFIHHLLDRQDPASAGLQTAMQQGLGRVKFRTIGEIRDLFGGLELVEPGVVPVPDWHPDPDSGTTGQCRDPVLGLAAAGVARTAGSGEIS